MNIYPSGHLIGRFEVIGLLGEGATAQVYQVRHTALGTEYALKLLTATRSGLRSRLLQEGQVQARLRHDNLVAVTDIIEHEGRAGLVMEFIGGASLEAALLRHGRMSVPDALALFLPILDAVEAAHQANILHRDLKPANILLADTDGGVVPKVTDFGIAKVFTDGDGVAVKGRTRVGLAMGTPGYMAPEQWADSSSVDARADIFSLGVVLYEMLTGQLPYSGETSLGLLGATMSGTPAPMAVIAPNVPRRLVSVIELAIRPDPATRFTNVDAFRQALLMEEEARFVPPPLPPPRRSRWFAWLAGLTGLTAVMVVGAGIIGLAVVVWQQQPGEEEEPNEPLVANEPVVLDEFSIDRTEVSDTEYRVCRSKGDCTPLSRSADDPAYAGLIGPKLPVVGVDWNQAVAYCTWRGGRLPTEAEWALAAEKSQQDWPWGSGLDCTRANYEGCPAGQPLPAGSMAAGESPTGIRHLVGNVWEWTSTVETQKPGFKFKGSKTELKLKTTTKAVLRGGGYTTSAEDLKEGRYLAGKGKVSPLYGFRCAY